MRLIVNSDRALMHFESYARGLSKNGVKVAVTALNEVGSLARKEVIKAEAKATGLSTKILGRALHETRATAESTQYEIQSAGGEISLHYFSAHETREGVSAKVLGARKVFPGTFMKAGGFLKGRIEKPNWNGQVFRRAGWQMDRRRKGSNRFMDAFVKVKSGVVIPREMVSGEPLRAFEFTSSRFPDFVLRRLSSAQLELQAAGKRDYGQARIWQD